VSPDSAIILTTIISVTIIVIGLFSFFVIMMVRSHRKIEAEQRERIHQMQIFSEKLQAAREEEQKQIARELHDELGGALTSIKYDLLSIEQNSSMQGDAKLRFQTVRNMVDSTTKLVQRISSGLRPKILDTVGLSAALEWHIGEFKKRTGINTTLKQTDELPTIDSAVTTGVYRIVQEALTNIARHSEATSAEVSIQHKDDKLLVEINDNGKGLSDEQIAHPDSLGIMSMQERARIIDGKVSFSSNNGKGTRVSLTTPLHKIGNSAEQSKS
jgi:signal transduction histidine kinase